MLHTSARFLNAFADKAEFMGGIDRQLFSNKFERVPTEQLPAGLLPALTHSFVESVC
jgi:hypothetical protein